MNKNNNQPKYDKKGYTVLHYACKRPSLEIVKYLIESGYDINSITNNEQCKSVLESSIIGGDIEIVDYLINNGADINYQNNQGFSALHVAIEQNRTYLAIYLILKHINFNAIDKNGCTALHVASKLGNLTVIETLLDKGANGSILDSNGYTPLHYAILDGNIESIDIILETHPKLLKIKTKNNFLPSDFARMNDQLDAEQLLNAYEEDIFDKENTNVIISVAKDFIARDARPFMCNSIIIPLLLAALAYTDWPYNIFTVSFVVAMFYAIILSADEYYSSMMGIGLWTHVYTNFIYFGNIVPGMYFYLPKKLLNQYDMVILLAKDNYLDAITYFFIFSTLRKINMAFFCIIF